MVADGNVLTGVGGGTADAQGADGAVVTGVAHSANILVPAVGGLGGTGILGDYGTLILAANGTYTYTLNNASPAVQHLADGQLVSDIFTYTITDGDGDTSTTTITINVTGTGDAPIILVGGADCTPEDTAMSATFTATPVDTLSAVTQITISGLTGWTPSATIGLSSGIPGVTTFVAGVLTINVTGATAGTAVTATVSLTPPPNSDVDAHILVGATTTYNGHNTTSAGTAATLYVDGVADAPTSVSITVADSADAGNSFSLGETGKVHVHAVFSDLDGSETHTTTVTLAQGFTSSLGATGAFDFGGVHYTYTSSVAAGVTTYVITAPSNVATVDFDMAVTAPASGTLPSVLNFDLTATSTEMVSLLSGGGCDTNNTDITADNIASLAASTGIPSTHILDGSMVTNTNSSPQTMILSFMDASGDPLDSFSQIVLRSCQGQQGAVLSDAGFSINPNDSYNVAAEDTAASPNKVIITNFTLEGVTIAPTNGQIQLDYDQAGSTNEAFTAVITPSAGGTVIGNFSTDGTGANQTLTDANSTLHYTYGAAGNDVLNGGTGPDFLNGGAGSDIMNGGNGNDVIVFDLSDLLPNSIDGGAGWDIVRVDNGALFNTTSQGGPTTGFANAIVDMHLASITNIEEILITEEAIPSDLLGTTIVLTAQNVVDFTGAASDTLYVVGSKGDSINLTQNASNTVGWIDTGAHVASAGGQVFDLWTATIGGHVASLYVDQDITNVNVTP